MRGLASKVSIGAVLALLAGTQFLLGAARWQWVREHHLSGPAHAVAIVLGVLGVVALLLALFRLIGDLSGPRPASADGSDAAMAAPRGGFPPGDTALLGVAFVLYAGAMFTPGRHSAVTLVLTGVLLILRWVQGRRG